MVAPKAVIDLIRIKLHSGKVHPIRHCISKVGSNMLSNGNSSPVSTGLATTWRSALCIFAVAILGNLVLVLNTGFFSHDEWQKYDFVTEKGYAAFANALGRLQAGPNFGAPVRPLGFLQQGFVSQWMVSAPIIPHLFSVLLHALTAVLLWQVLLAVNVRQRVARVAAILFAISPLALPAVGWTAASFDQWYVLFALGATCVALRLLESGFHVRSCLLLLLWSAGAMLSKETAMVLPAAVGASIIGKNMLDRRPWQWRVAILAALLSALPVIGFLLIRLPAIINTLHGAGGSGDAYKPSLSSFVPNAIDYFQFPFLWHLAELIAITAQPMMLRVFASIVHLVVVAALFAKGGWRVVLVYLASYFIFLLPVLVIPTLGAHYLYASAIPLSVALAYLLGAPGPAGVTRTVSASVALCSVVLLAIHSYHIQKDFQRMGRCQVRLLTSLDQQMLLRPAEEVINVVVPFGVPGYVGVRSTFGRDKYKNVHFDESGKSPEQGALVMKPSCEVVED